MILEDDFTFARQFCAKLETSILNLKNRDPRWDLLYLGREPLGVDFSLSKGITRPGYSFGAYAYMLSQAGVRKLLSAGYPEHLIPVDEFLPAMYTDHPREDVRRVYTKRLSAYALEPPLVPEIDDLKWGSDTEASDFLRGKGSDT